MSDRRLLIEIAADSSKFSAGVQRAVADAQQLADLIKRHGKELERADEERANIKKALLGNLTAAEKQALKEQQIDAQRHYANLKSLYNDNKRDLAAAEREVTNIVKREAHERTAAVRASFAVVATSAKNMALSIASAFGVVQLGERILGGIKQAVTGYAELGHEVKHLADIMGTSVENASVLDYIFKQFGMTGAHVTQTIAQLTRHVVDNEKDFQALGVQTRDANGNLLSTYDIFMSLRSVMSDSADGTAKLADMLKLLARSGSAGGVALGELQQVLGLNADQIAAFKRQAEANNAVLDKSQALIGTDMVQAGRELQQAMDGLGRTFGALAVGPLTGVINAVSSAISMFELLTSTAAASMSSLQGIPIISGLLNLYGNSSDIVTGNRTDALTSIQEKMKQIEADRKSLANLGSGEGTAQLPTFPSGGSGPDLGAQALQDEIAAIREAAKAREEAMRDALAAFERERNAAIRAIEDERKGRDAMFAAMVTNLQEEQRARDDAHQADLQRIGDEQRARDEAFAIRQRDRDSEISGIRAEVAAIDRQSQAESDLQNIQNAQKTLDHEKFIEVNKGKTETLEAYYRRTFDHEQRLTNDTERLSGAKTKKVIDDRKAEMDAAIKAIEAVGIADRRQTEDAKKNAEARIRDIQREMAEEKKKTEAAVKAIQEQQKTEKAASDAKVQGLRDQLAAEKQRVDDALKQIQKQTDATVKALDEQLKAHQRAAGGMGSAYVHALKDIKRSAEEAAAAFELLQAAIQKVHAPGGARDPFRNDDKPFLVDTGPSNLGGDGAVWTQPRNDLFAPTFDAKGSREELGAAVNKWMGGFRQWIRGVGPTPAFGRGGSLTLTEPTALLGLTSGTYHAIAGEAGIETATFTPGAGSRQGNGGHRSVAVTVNVHGLAYPEATREVARAVRAELEYDARVDESRGYTVR